MAFDARHDKPAEVAERPYWSLPAADVLSALDASPRGLSASEAARRLTLYGANTLKPQAISVPLVLLRQFRSPLVLILIVAAGISAAVGDVTDAIIVSLIVAASCGLSFAQEWGASRAVESLRRQLQHKVSVLRDGRDVTVAAEAVVPGDIVKLSAGALVPGDGIVLEAGDCTASEGALTGEPFPVIKAPAPSEATAPPGSRSNMIFAGTSIRSGTAAALIVTTGPRTEFARIAATLERQIPETGFARGIRHFGYLMTQIMLVMVTAALVVNLWLHRPVIDALLFSLALAVGITPELLPAIVSVTLARGARRMATDGVIVRRLEAIENLGSMDILCTDKTGTLTEGVIRLSQAVDARGAPSDDVLRLAALNAQLQTGLKNPLDDAICLAAKAPAATKLGEIPYDFERKCLSVIVRADTGPALIVCKGAVKEVLARCTSLIDGGDTAAFDTDARAAVQARFEAWSRKGFRVIAVAARAVDTAPAYDRSIEHDLTLSGFLLFFDPPKAGIVNTLASLANRGVRVKMITGDNRYVAVQLAQTVGLSSKTVLTGEDLDRMTREALLAAAPRTEIFAEIAPNQKERIVAALRKAGHVVGYLGDGINDAPALHEADVGISVDTAVEVAREAADMVLLKQDLDVLLAGINDGRRTFVNTLKYISIATSANFGNMVSMAVASFALPFLPLLAKQILLNNFLSDIPAMAIAGDTVESDVTRTPRRWDIGYVRRFMVRFGLLSSAFDALTFAFLLFVAHDGAPAFRTGWFVESLITQLGTLLIVRTRRPVWKSRPGKWLVRITLAMMAMALILPATPIAGWFDFVVPPWPVVAGLAVISAAYFAALEGAKHLFFKAERHHAHSHGSHS